MKREIICYEDEERTVFTERVCQCKFLLMTEGNNEVAPPWNFVLYRSV